MLMSAKPILVDQAHYVLIFRVPMNVHVLLVTKAILRLKMDVLISMNALQV